MSTMYKILVAEDDNFLANAYRLKLTREGYEVKVVYDGGEVFKLLESYTPDLIILDLIMPKMDGFLTLEYLKKTQKWKNIPVLIASNLGQSEDIVKATKLGAEDYIVKTDLSMKEVVQKVKAALNKEENATSPRQPNSS